MDELKRVIVALDFADEKTTMAFVARLQPSLCRLKVGKELFTRCGPQLVEKLASAGYDVFLDLKYHDIPNTVARACVAAADLGVWMLNVHAMGGQAMMQAARDALNTADSPLLIAVTLLTSSGQKELDALGVNDSPAGFVKKLATMTRQAGLDGVVCSAQEASVLRRTCGDDFKLVTPGIRLAGGGSDDQLRICTPEQAVQNGSDYLVIGRPVTQSEDPCQTLLTINDSIR
ncbi:MAG TPA: orotidine-5'-phosphate decarboxylase [Thiotrichales bacterium]|nr:orotidine-5'-phosphate decarboxylase [Thiotrichales bacterium]